MLGWLLVVSQACVYFLLEQSHLWGAKKKKTECCLLPLSTAPMKKGRVSRQRNRHIPHFYAEGKEDISLSLPPSSPHTLSSNISPFSHSAEKAFRDGIYRFFLSSQHIPPKSVWAGSYILKVVFLSFTECSSTLWVEA